VANSDLNPPQSNLTPPRWDPREFWIVILSVMLITTSVSWAGQSLPWLGAWGALIIAVVFLYLPIEILERKRLDVRKFGIWRGDLKLGLRNWLIVSLLVLPPYAACFHTWQVNVVGSEAKFTAQRVLDWPLEFEPQSPQVLPKDGFQTSLRSDTVFLGWRIPTAKSVEVRIRTTKPISVTSRSNGTSQLITNSKSELFSHEVLLRGPAQGQVRLHSETTRIRIDVQSDKVTLDGDRLLDAYGQNIGSNPIDSDRDLWWLFNFILGQLLLVALPEEVFYRGYVQSRLEQKYPRNRKFMGVEVSWKALIYTSGIFAIGHILTISHPARLAVFFPSLLFGWMRNATGSVLSAVLFHATCNLFAHLAFKFYL
jgi:hypothetical protein